MIDVKKIFWDSLRMYFAPLVGAFTAIKAELDRSEQEHKHAYEPDDGPLSKTDLAWVKSVAEAQRPKGKLIKKRKLCTRC